MKKSIIVFTSLFSSMFAMSQSDNPNYYKILRMDTVQACKGKNLNCDQMTQCQLRYIDLMTERWWNSYGPVLESSSKSIWFYGDYEDQVNFTFDSVSVKITTFGDKGKTEKYMLTPKEAEAFFMKKKK